MSQFRCRPVVPRAAIAMLLLLFSETAFVGQLHINTIGLDVLVERSTDIVVAVPDDPPAVEERVAIKVPGKKVPPYVRIVQRYRVRESLRGELEPGVAIEVNPAYDAQRERLHREYHVTGKSRHVALDRYQPATMPSPGEPRLLFLRRDDGRISYAADDAADGIARRNEVERLLGRRD